MDDIEKKAIRETRKRKQEIKNLPLNKPIDNYSLNQFEESIDVDIKPFEDIDDETFI